VKRTILCIALLLLIPSSGLAETSLIDDQFTSEQKETFEEVQGNIMSPYCPGRLLKDCPSSAARNLKLDLKSRILEGENSEEILEDLYTDFGEEMRAAPKAEGVGILAWLAPVVFLAVGFLILLFWLGLQKRNG
jgi:cytochrome c-type biogenesis protein CcmH